MEPFDWNKLLEFARLLQRGGDVKEFDRQAVVRSAISRAYFSAYRIARTYAVQYLGFADSAHLSDDHGRLRALTKGSDGPMWPND